MSPSSILAVVIVVAIALLVVRSVLRLLRRRRFVSDVDRATYETLHTASLAARHLRSGLTPQAAERATRQLRSMLGSRAIALTDSSGVLAWDGVGGHHRLDLPAQAEPVLTSGTTVVDRKSVV